MPLLRLAPLLVGLLATFAAPVDAAPAATGRGADRHHAGVGPGRITGWNPASWHVDRDEADDPDDAPRGPRGHGGAAEIPGAGHGPHDPPPSPGDPPAGPIDGSRLRQTHRLRF